MPNHSFQTKRLILSHLKSEDENKKQTTKHLKIYFVTTLSLLTVLNFVQRETTKKLPKFILQIFRSQWDLLCFPFHLKTGSLLGKQATTEGTSGCWWMKSGSAWYLSMDGILRTTPVPQAPWLSTSGWMLARLSGWRMISPLKSLELNHLDFSDPGSQDPGFSSLWNKYPLLKLKNW